MRSSASLKRNMNKRDPLTDLKQKLAELESEEKHLKDEMKLLAANIQKNATPMGIAKGVVSGMFPAKGGPAAETAKTALGLGVGLVASNLAAKQKRVALVGKLAALAVGFAINQIAERKKRRAESKAG